MPRVVVVGGSVGGLTAALVLRDAGCDVTVFERSSAALQARGAGIAALEATLRYLTERGGRRRADGCSSPSWIRLLRPDAGLPDPVLRDRPVLVAPIPGPGGAPTAGQRLVNFVWYVNVAGGEALDELMTGRDGIRRPVSLPPGAATDEVVTAMRRSAQAAFAPPVAEVVTGVDEPFVQVIYDIAVPRMAFGRVCLLGDAAFAVRPHAAAGTAQAAAGGWALAGQLEAAGGGVPAAPAGCERRRLALRRALPAPCPAHRDIAPLHAP